jgi:hypothetical protein
LQVIGRYLQLEAEPIFTGIQASSSEYYINIFHDASLLIGTTIHETGTMNVGSIQFGSKFPCPDPNSQLFQPTMPSTARTDVVLPMTDDYMQQIVRGEKNYEFRKYRIAPTVSPPFSPESLGPPKLDFPESFLQRGQTRLVLPYRNLSRAFPMFAR